MCEFHGSNGNGFGDIWWTDNPIYFSSIDVPMKSKGNGLSCLKSFYSKQSILGLTQEFCWVGARIGSGVAFETLNYRDEVSERKVKVN